MSYSDLPVLKDLLEPHACSPPQTYTICKCKKIDETKHEPSRSLQNWKKWMNRRKKIHLKLAGMIQRDPNTLLMNQSENCRTLKERKTIVENAQLSLYRNAKIHPVEYVIVPNKIMSEKDVNEEAGSITAWTESAYLKKRCEELSIEMRVVEPHKPELSNLYIEGISLLRENEKQITQKEQITNINKGETEIAEKKLKVCLIVNNVILTPTVKQSKTRKVYIMFDYDLTTKNVETQYLSLTNVGNTALHYSWGAVKNIPLFRDILPEKEHITYFVFNKNKGVIIPQETINLPICFETSKPGVYSENWELHTRPKIVPANDRVIIAFHASAAAGDLYEKMEVIKEKLNANIRDRLIKETLSYVLSKVAYSKFKPTIYCYNKKEVFEAMSATYDPTNLFPKYEYNRDVVRELQKFYKSVRRNVDPKNWSYSIYELKLLTNAKQKSNENAKYLSNQQVMKKLETACPVLPPLESPKTLFPLLESDSRLQQKNTVLLPEELLEMKKQMQTEIRSLNEELNNLLSKLERPNTEKNFHVDKYTKAYLLLCTCFNKIESEIEYLKQKLGIDRELKYPNVRFTSEFYQYERLLDTFPKPNVKENIQDCRYQPANEKIKNIPPHECALKYKMYFNLLDSADASHKKEVPKVVKKPEEVKKIKVIEPEEDDGYPINETFDPYAKLELIPFKETVKTPTIIDKIPVDKPENIQVIMHHYTYYIYVIVYHHLQEAINNIIDMLEMYSFQKTPHPVIKEIEEPNYTRRLIDLKSLIIQENIDNIKAKIVLQNYRKKSKLDWKSIETQRELKRVHSSSSLWSILRPYEKRELYEEKPISYPTDVYEDEILLKSDEAERDIIERTTSTTEPQIDDTWQDIKTSAIQKDYEPDDKIDDLEAYIEKVKSETSVHSLIDMSFEKATQKDSDSHVSDEEHFYYSLTDSELSDISIESTQNDLICEEEIVVKKVGCDCRKQ